MLASQFPGPAFFKIKKTEHIWRQIDVRIGQPLARRGTGITLHNLKKSFYFARKTLTRAENCRLQVATAKPVLWRWGQQPRRRRITKLGTCIRTHSARRLVTRIWTAGNGSAVVRWTGPLGQACSTYAFTGCWKIVWAIICRWTSLSAFTISSYPLMSYWWSVRLLIKGPWDQWHCWQTGCVNLKACIIHSAHHWNHVDWYLRLVSANTAAGKLYTCHRNKLFSRTISLPNYTIISKNSGKNSFKNTLQAPTQFLHTPSQCWMISGTLNWILWMLSINNKWTLKSTMCPMLNPTATNS